MRWNLKEVRGQISGRRIEITYKQNDDLFSVTEEEAHFQKYEAFTGGELVHETHRLALMNAMLHDIEGKIYLCDTLLKLRT